MKPREQRLGYKLGRYVIGPLFVVCVVLLLLWGISSAARGIVSP